MRQLQATNIGLDIATPQVEIISKVLILTATLIHLLLQQQPKHLAEFSLTGQVLRLKLYQDGK